MPDSYGFPTEPECVQLLDVVGPDPALAALLRQVQPILAAVIAEFQRPPDASGKGGTGRLFAATSATRLYDGSGMSYLFVDDIVPGSSLTVTAYGAPFPDAILSNEFYSLGRNTLIRPTFSQTAYPLAYWNRTLIFPRGRQNISVTTTWGFAATVPADVYQAIREEVVYRLLITGTVGLNGVGEDLKVDDFELNTSSGAINFNLTSPLTVFHANYTRACDAYRFIPREMPGRHGRKMY